MLAVCWAISKCRMFLTGLQHFIILTDHNPLIPILNNYRLNELENPRLQRLKTRLMAYNFTAQWLKGSKNDAPDALSRHPVSDPQTYEALAELDIHDNPDISLSEIRVISDQSNKSLRLQELCTYSEQDEEYLANLHEAHQGALQTKQRARLTVYWPGLDNDIDNAVLSCQYCQDHQPSNTKEPIIHRKRPSRPFQGIAIDLCSQAGHDYLIIVDCFTDWPAIIPMIRNTTSSQINSALRQAFCRTAIPDVIWSDCGPQFTSNKFKQFAQQWGFLHKTSSPYHPQSNGKIESTVKSMKRIIPTSWNGRSLDEDKVCRALLQYRNTPSWRDGLSPAQKLYGHPTQDILPAHRRSFAQEWQHKAEEVEQQAQVTQQSTTDYYNAHAHPLADIDIGSNVAIQNPHTKLWDIYGIVTDISPNRRYYVKTLSGRVLVQNHRFLRRRVPLSIPSHLDYTQLDTTSTHTATSPRRSTRLRQLPKRLIEDPTWN